MTILWYILIGLAVGILARLILPGKRNMNFVVSGLLGIIGSFLVGQGGVWLDWWNFPTLLGILAPVATALVFNIIYAIVRRNS